MSQTVDVYCVFHFASFTLTFNKGLARFLDPRGFIQISHVQNNFSLFNFSHSDLGEYGMHEIAGKVAHISCVPKYCNVLLKQQHQGFDKKRFFLLADVLSSDAPLTAPLWGATGGPQLTD